MRDGRFASWENIVSRFQTSPPWKKKADSRKWIFTTFDQTHASSRNFLDSGIRNPDYLTWGYIHWRKSVFSYLFLSWPYVCISWDTFTDFGNHFGEYCGLTKIPKSDLWQKIPKPVKKFYHTLTMEVGKGINRSTYRRQRLTLLLSVIRQKDRREVWPDYESPKLTLTLCRSIANWRYGTWQPRKTVTNI